MIGHHTFHSHKHAQSRKTQTPNVADMRNHPSVHKLMHMHGNSTKHAFINDERKMTVEEEKNKEGEQWIPETEETTQTTMQNSSP